MQELNALIKNRFQKAPKAISERGELLQYFLDGINAGRDGKRYRRLSIGFIAKKLQGLELRDLYYLKSICEDGRRRGVPFGKVFLGH